VDKLLESPLIIAPGECITVNAERFAEKPGWLLRTWEWLCFSGAARRSPSWSDAVCLIIEKSG